MEVGAGQGRGGIAKQQSALSIQPMKHPSEPDILCLGQGKAINRRGREGRKGACLRLLGSLLRLQENVSWLNADC